MAKNESTEQSQDAWLLDDGIGCGLFSGDILNQVDAKKGQELDDYIEDVKAGARLARVKGGRRFTRRAGPGRGW